MGHGKLKKFAENETFRCLLQPDASAILNKEPGSKALRLKDHAIKGRWGADMFGNDHPIVLELGCGKGDYTIALAQRHPEMNFIGVDIKGARLWKGAKFATENALPNVAFRPRWPRSGSPSPTRSCAVPRTAASVPRFSWSVTAR